MANTKEIRTKIKSIKNTQKITAAMQMVAASKMRRAQERMEASRPYAEKIRQVVNHVGVSHSEYRHPFLEVRPIKTVGIIVVSSDRGLSGGLNSNLFRMLLPQMQAFEQAGYRLRFALFGAKAESFFKRMGANVDACIKHIKDAPKVTDIIGPVQVMLDLFYKGEIDCLHIAYNKFVNTMTQQPILQQLLPIAPQEIFIEPTQQEKAEGHKKISKDKYWDYLYEPDAKELLDFILMRFIEAEVYQGAVENLACEQAARMVAMKSASDNAGDLINDLQLVYNKARQASITQELSEIVSGAQAV
jgi:F-type H+-transporting ATPase subunit gamma